MTYESAIAALSDPTRRQIFEEIVKDGPHPVGQVAARVPVSRPAVSQHLAVLAEAGLVRVEARGARRLYRADPKGLEALRAWLEGMWADALANFKDEIDRGSH
jgi:DNA-binding transcriptional ArsR family regulator